MYKEFGKKGLILFWYSPTTNIDQTKIFAYNFNLSIGKRLEFSIKWSVDNV